MGRQSKTPKKPSVSRGVLTDNLAAMIKARYSELPNETAMVKALAKDSGIGYGAVKRLLSGQTGLSIDKLEDVATALDLLPYQLLLPGLDPSNPQIANGADSGEKRLYAALRRSGVLSKK